MIQLSGSSISSTLSIAYLELEQEQSITPTSTMEEQRCYGSIPICDASITVGRGIPEALVGRLLFVLPPNCICLDSKFLILYCWSFFCCAKSTKK